MDQAAFKEQLSKAIEHCATELASVRTNRVTPSLVEHVPVACYGSTMPLLSVASITAPEPMMLLVEVWDASILQSVERGIRDADVGFSVAVDGQRVRLRLPQLTEERRIELTKHVREKAEEARVVVRKIREDGMKELRRTAEGTSEDLVEREEKEMQKSVEDANASIENLVVAKERDLLTT